MCGAAQPDTDLQVTPAADAVICAAQQASAVADAVVICAAQQNTYVADAVVVCAAQQVTPVADLLSSVLLRQLWLWQVGSYPCRPASTQTSG